MAKDKTGLGAGDLFRRTEPSQPQAEQPQAEDRVKARGVGLKLSEWAELDAWAAGMGIKTHALLLFAIRDFMRRWRAGEVKTETRTLPRL